MVSHARSTDQNNTPFYWYFDKKSTPFCGFLLVNFLEKHTLITDFTGILVLFLIIVMTYIICTSLFSFSDIDECSEGLHACNNNQWCRNLQGSYECPCRGGFDGLNCEEDLDECSKPGVCPAGSVCTTDEFNAFSCKCPPEGCFIGLV